MGNCFCCAEKKEKILTLVVEYTESEFNSCVEIIHGNNLRARVCPWETFAMIERRLEEFQWQRQISIFSAATTFDGRFCALKVVKSKYENLIIKPSDKLIPVARFTKMAKDPRFDVYIYHYRGGACCGGVASNASYAPTGKVVPVNVPDEAGKREYVPVLPSLAAPPIQRIEIATTSAAVAGQPAAAAPAPSPSSSLKQLADMYQRGLLTDEEFAAAKARELGTPSPQPESSKDVPIF